MARFYEIQIDSIFLSKDGSETAEGAGRCRLDVDGVDRLQSNYVKTVQRDMRNNPVIQKTECGSAGRDITINVNKMPVSVANSLIALHQTKEATDTVIHIIGTDGDTPDFDLYVLPSEPAFSFKEFSGSGHYLNSVLRYITVGETFVMHDSQFVIHGGDGVVYTA